MEPPPEQRVLPDWWVIRESQGRRGHKTDPAWAARNTYKWTFALLGSVYAA